MKTMLRGVFTAAVMLVGMFVGPQVVSAQNFGFTATTGFTTNDVCTNSGTPASTCQVLTDGSPSQPTVVSGGSSAADDGEYEPARRRLVLPATTALHWIHHGVSVPNFEHEFCACSAHSLPMAWRS